MHNFVGTFIWVLSLCTMSLKRLALPIKADIDKFSINFRQNQYENDTNPLLF